MLGYQPFYWQTIRKIITVFGALFNGIEMVKYDPSTRVELGRITVPLTYEGKETFVTRLNADPTLTKGMQIVLPAMTYEFKNMQYAADRKVSSFVKNKILGTGQSNLLQYSLATPYDLLFDLNLYVRNMEDGLQIIEQIVPFFAPDYTVSLKYLITATDWVSEDLPIVLEEIQFDNDYQGAAGSVRQINWTLTFKVKALFYGPIPNNSNIIKEVIVNLRDYNSGNTQAVIDLTVNPPTANITDNWTINTTINEFTGNT